jgi:hypothetical protein
MLVCASALACCTIIALYDCIVIALSDCIVCCMLLLLSPAVAVFGPVAVWLVHSLLDLLMHSSL